MTRVRWPSSNGRLGVPRRPAELCGRLQRLELRLLLRREHGHELGAGVGAGGADLRARRVERDGELADGGVVGDAESRAAFSWVRVSRAEAASGWMSAAVSVWICFHAAI